MEKKLKKLESLKKKHEQLKAQIQTLEAAKKSRDRKRDTRRKILIGAYYLDKVMQENKFPEIVKIMDGYLTRNSDRILFDLPLLDKKSLISNASE